MLKFFITLTVLMLIQNALYLIIIEIKKSAEDKTLRRRPRVHFDVKNIVSCN